MYADYRYRETFSKTDSLTNKDGWMDGWMKERLLLLLRVSLN